MVNAITGAFNVIGAAAIGLIVAVVIVAFGAMMLDDFRTQAVADYGNTSDAVAVIDDGQQGLLDFSDNFGLVVIAIIFVIVLALVMLIKRSAESAN